jgi:DNA-binding NarL/FixJ family response regulator
VLVVDDQAGFRAAAVAMVAVSDGFHVAGAAAGGEEAIARCRDGDIDLVLLDVNMPGTDGIDAARRIRADTENCVVVLMSTYSPADLPADVHASGCAYVQKATLDPDLLEQLWLRAGNTTGVTDPDPAG